MLKLIKTLLKFLGLIVLVVAAFSAIVAWRGNWFRQLDHRFAGSCESLPLAGSAEDIQLDRARGYAYLSLLDRRSLVAGGDAQGTIMRVNLNVRPLAAEPALLDQPAHFRPHGLSLFVAADGQRYLFSLNHPARRGEEPEMVELFRESTPGQFTHVRTWTDSAFLSPNDLVAVGPDSFYVANDKAAGGLAAALQQLGIGGSPLVYVAGDAVRVVKDDIASGGGINASADGRRLYVAETAAQRIRVLDRDPANGAVTDVTRIGVVSSPDNVDVAADGSLWIGAHANTLKLIQHFVRNSPAPSQVLRVQLAPDGQAASIEDIYTDDGTEFSASSVGVNYDNLLLIGSITEPRVLVCTMQ